jgi:hypothetical protein
MKTILILCGVVLAAGLAIFFFAARGTADHHGNPFRGLPPAEIAALVDRPAEYLKKDLRIEGTLARQCPSSGCWFFLKDSGGKELKVEMGDTTPKRPQRLGKRAVVEGQLIRFGDRFEFIGTAVEFH